MSRMCKFLFQSRNGNLSIQLMEVEVWSSSHPKDRDTSTSKGRCESSLSFLSVGKTDSNCVLKWLNTLN